MSGLVSVADYISGFISRLGVRCVFLVPGGGAMYLVDAIGRNPELEFVPNHHEQAAAIAAEAYARINGLGVALVTTGPGGTNAVTGVAGAWIESVPLLVVSGQVKRADLMDESGLRQKGPQEVDIVSIVRPITKYAVTIRAPSEVRYHLEKAIHLATSGRQGPVWLDVPLDVQAARIDPSTLHGFVPERATLDPTLGDRVGAVVDLLNAAQRPVLLAGHGIRLAGAADAFRELYERLDVPVATTWNASDLIPSSHRLSIGKPGGVAQRPPNFAIQNSDLLIAIGARLDNAVTAFNPAKFGRNARRVIVDVDPAELAKFDANVELAIQADAKVFIEELLGRTTRLQPVDRADWHARCHDWKRRYPVGEDKPLAASGPISHYDFVRVLSEELPEDILIVTGSSGLAVEFFYSGFENKPGQRIMHTSGLGAMGYGLPAAIGAGMGAGVPFVAVEGDGSLMLNLQELLTVRALDLPVRLFVMNNRGYASIRNTQRNYFDGRYVGTGPEARLLLPDFVALAETVGIPAIRISDAFELRPRIRETLARPGPFVCDVTLIADEPLWPKTTAIPLPDGSMISMPLEDMAPLLPRDELRNNMLIPLDPASEQLPMPAR